MHRARVGEEGGLEKGSALGDCGGESTGLRNAVGVYARAWKIEAHGITAKER